MGELIKYEAARHTFCVRSDGSYRKLFKVQFSGTDGSLFLHVPYYRDCEGIVAVCTIAAGGSPSTTVDLTEGGKITSRRLKYSHHPDGRAHFSQDGQVLTAVKKDAHGLEDFTGHVFTLHIQGPSDFRDLPSGDDAQQTGEHYDHLLSANAEGAISAMKFVGEWTGRDRFEEQLARIDVGPQIAVADGDEQPDLALLVGPPQGRPPLAHLQQFGGGETRNHWSTPISPWIVAAAG